MRNLVKGRKIVGGIEKPEGIGTVSTWLRRKMPSVLKQKNVILEGWQWIGLALLVLVGFILNTSFAFSDYLEDNFGLVGL